MAWKHCFCMRLVFGAKDTQNQMMSAKTVPNSRRWIGWLFLSVALLVEAGVTVIIDRLRERADACRRVQTELAFLRADAQELNALEWETISNEMLNEESATHLDKILARMQERFSRLGLLGSRLHRLEDVTQSHRAYIRLVDQEFKLIAAARIKEAKDFDAAKVDPAFDALETALGATEGAYDKLANRTLGQIRAGTLMLLFGGVGFIAALVWQFTEKRRVVEVAAAEQRTLRQANENLEARVRERTRELEDVHKQLVEASRLGGMAEIATNVLHNVGNVLNSVNISATLVADRVRHSKGANIAKLAALFAEHQADLSAFLTTDPRGKMIPAYLATLKDSLAEEQKTVSAELDNLRKNIEHIKEIVAKQQSYAKTSVVMETVALAGLVEDALRINATSLLQQDVEVVRDFQIQPLIRTDKHKVMNILINLVSNAKFACDETGRSDKRFTVRITGDAHTVRVSVSDNGVGIPAENLTRIFAHGFSSKKTSHGLGLHSGALAAKQIGGALSVQSDGPGCGANFTLELPCRAESDVCDPVGRL